MKDFNTIHKREIPLKTLWNPRKNLTLLSVILFFLCTHTGIYGQTYVTSTASVAGGNSWPFNANPGSNKVELSYSPGDWNTTPKSGYIKTVYFRFASASSTTYSNFSISMAQLAVASVTSTSTYTSPVSVCYGPTTAVISPTAGVWYKMALTTGFLFNPKLALIVQVQQNAMSGGGNTIGTTTETLLPRGRIYGTYGNSTGTADNSRYDFGFDVSPAANNNAGVTTLITPVNFCPATYGIQVKAANLGLNDLTSVQIGWSFDNVIQTPITWNYKIPVGRDTTITLGTETFASNVTHKLKVWTYNPNNTKDTTTADDTLFVNSMVPAISGTYTINPALGTGGTNFANFTAACNFLNANGVCGPVLFKVAQGTYVEQVSLTNVQGTSAINTITFDGGVDSTKTTVTSSANPTVSLGSPYTIFKHMTVRNTGSNCGVFLTSYITLANCRILCDSTGTTTLSTPVNISGSATSPTSSGGGSFNTITHCTITGGYYGGVAGFGNTSSLSIGNTVSYCTITKAYLYTTYILYQNKFTFSHNYLKDRGVTNGYALLEYCSNSLIDGNYFNSAYYNELYGLDYTIVTGGTTYVTNNAFYGHSYNSTDQNYFYYWYGTKCWYNVFYETGPGGSYAAYWYNPTNLDVRNNIFVRTSASQYSFYISSVSSFSNFDYNDIWDIPGVSGGPYMNGIATLAAWQLANYGKPYACANCVDEDPGFKSLNAGSEDFHMAKTSYGISGNGTGITTLIDIDGDKRCPLFPNMGLDEVLTGKGAPNVKFYPTSNLFPGSPSVIFSNYKPGAPVKSTWYIINATYSTFTKVPAEGYIRGGDSVTLYTTKFTTGFNTVKLVQQTCGGTDSFTFTFTVNAPTAVPLTDFVSNKNNVVTGDIVTLHDLSTNGPQTWIWKVSPDSVISGGAKVSSYAWTFPSATTGSKYQNPQLKFLYPGKYTICLQTTNGVGKGPNVCKTNYINVLPTINIGTAVVTTASGYLYDDGGPSSAYISNGGAPSTLIQPCADSVYLSFSMFDLSCNVAFLQLYEGVNVKGRRLDPCGGSGLNSGFTGGPTATCSAPCFPSLTRPDTFKAAKSIFIQMNDGASNTNFKGFAAYWWSKPSSAKRPHANFTDNGSHDSVCVNAQVNFTNTSTIAAGDVNDPLSFLWDLDGDITTWECIGTCPTALWPYFLAGLTNVTLLATNCGGTDTMVKTLTVYTPKAPKAAILADNTNPTVGQTVFLSAPVVACVDDYKWTITKSAGAGSGLATFLNGTTNVSSNPQVSFSTSGYYDVKLYVDNNSGAAKDSITLKQYINVRGSYCIPSVAILNQGIGISSVKLNTLSNSVTQAQTDYTNFTGTQALTTSLALGVKYPVTITRDPSLIFEAINRSVFIDWNQDGSFTGKGEEAAEDSNSYSASWTGTVTVPKTATLGATRMRIAVNRGAYSNKPCGQNEFGEYQDYTVYVVAYSQPPVITLTGHQGLQDTIKLEQGHPFVEPGFKATSLLYRDLTKFVKRTSLTVGDPNVADSFNDIVAGKYIFSYNVTDSAGNKAITQYRVVQVTKDVTPPVLVIAQPDTVLMEVTAAPLIPFPAPAVISAVDLVDGPLTTSVTNDASKVTSNILGFYTITYTVSDLSGNVTKIYRWIHIIDTMPPTLSLIGTSPVSVEVHTAYIDAGANFSDNYDPLAVLNRRLKSLSTIDTSKLGSYKLTYYLTDSSGNQALPVTRVVNVIDTIVPTISLNGPQLDSVDIFTLYNDQGVTISDNYNKVSELTLVVTGTYYTAFGKSGKATKLGVYTIVYTVTDKSGNKSTVTRTVKVIDRVAPVITLNGSNAVTVCRWFNYVDAGYTVTDNYYASSTLIIDTFLNGNTKPVGKADLAAATALEGVFSVRFSATDGSGNTGWSPIRFIMVNPASSPACTSGIEPSLGLDKYISVYPNPNNGSFTINANLPSAEKVRMTVTNMLGQQIAVIHDGTLTSSSFQVDLSNQESGVYLLNIVMKNQTLARRIELVK